MGSSSSNDWAPDMQQCVALHFVPGGYEKAVNKLYYFITPVLQTCNKYVIKSLPVFVLLSNPKTTSYASSASIDCNQYNFTLESLERTIMITLINSILTSQIEVVRKGKKCNYGYIRQQNGSLLTGLNSKSDPFLCCALSPSAIVLCLRCSDICF